MPNFLSAIAAILKLSIIVCFLALCLIFTYTFIVTISSEDKIREMVYRTEFLVSMFLRGEDKTSNFLIRTSEMPSFPDGYIDSVSDHGSIASWVVECVLPKDVNNIPVSLERDVRFRPAFFQPYGGYSSFDENSEAATRKLNNQERALIYLSNVLANQRITLSERSKSSYIFWQFSTIVSIVIGMITTILVSISSTEFGRGDGLSQRVIRVFAIVFPALGTAAAAIIAFYSPQTVYNQSSRTVASIAQLHSQMAMEIWRLGCVDNEQDGDRKSVEASLNDWAKRYVDIQAVSNAAGGASDIQGSPDKGKGDQTPPVDPAVQGAAPPPNKPPT